MAPWTFAARGAEYRGLLPGELEVGADFKGLGTGRCV